MTEAEVAIAVAVVGAAASTMFSAFARRSGDREQAERTAREAQAARLGERIGALESFRDQEVGRRAGLEEARKGHGG